MANVAMEWIHFKSSNSILNEMYNSTTHSISISEHTETFRQSFSASIGLNFNFAGADLSSKFGYSQ